MPGKFIIWYRKLSPPKQIVFTLLCNLIFWFLSFVLIDQVVNDPHRSFSQYFFKSLWMALWMAVLYCWKQLKAIFKKKPGDTQTETTP